MYPGYGRRSDLSRTLQVLAYKRRYRPEKRKAVYLLTASDASWRARREPQSRRDRCAPSAGLASLAFLGYGGKAVLAHEA